MPAFLSVFNTLFDSLPSQIPLMGLATRDNEDKLFVEMLKLHTDLWRMVTTSNCVVAVPLSVSLGDEVSRDDLASHILMPATVPGEYCTLNGKRVSMVGSEIVTHSGFEEQRKARILSVDSHRDATGNTITIFR